VGPGPAAAERGRCGGGAERKARSRAKAAKNPSTGLWFGVVEGGIGSRTDQIGTDGNCWGLCVELDLLLRPLRLTLTSCWYLLVGRCSFAIIALGLRLKSSVPASPPPPWAAGGGDGS
jgi:hypothetical protein